MSEASNQEARLALVGPTSLIGREVRNQLDAVGCPGRLVELLDVDEAVGVLTDYGEEARVVIQAAEARLGEASLACFCGDPEAARRLAPVALQAGGTVIDCTGAFADDPDAELAGAPTEDLGADGLVVVPEAATLVLDELIVALGEAADEAAATVLLPASADADAGPDELARQAAELLNFGEPGAVVLGRRQAFDVFLSSAGLPARIRAQLATLGRTAVRISCLRASVFHGIGLSLMLPRADAEDVVTRLVEAGLEVGREDEDGARIDSPGRASGSTGLFVADVWGDRAGGCWIWAVADNHHVRARTASASIMARLAPRNVGVD